MKLRIAPRRAFRASFPGAAMVWMLAGTVLSAAVPNPDNLLVAHHRTIKEYTRAGALVQTIAIDSPDGADDWRALDLVMDRLGRVHVLNRKDSFVFSLSTLVPASGAWTHHTDPEWNLASVLYYGGISADDGHIYVPDQRTAGTTGQGVLRFPVDDLDAPERFAEDLALVHCVRVGLDGLVYALERGPNTGNLHVHDPVTLQRLRSVDVHAGASVQSVGVDADGEIFAIDLDGRISHFDPSGTLLNQITSDVARVDLDLDEAGTIVCGSGGTSVSITDRSLGAITHFATVEEEFLSEGFVTFARYIRKADPTRNPSNRLSAAVHSGDPAPGAGEGAVFASFGKPVINNAGEIAFCAGLARDTGLGIDTTNDAGIWSGPPDALNLVAREGGPTPDLPTGVVFSTFCPPDYNLRFDDSGLVGFPATLRGPGIDAGNDSAFFAGSPGALRLVAREGDPVPGTEAGVVFGDLRLVGEQLRSGGPGEVWMRTKLVGTDGTNDTVFLGGAPGDLRLLLREGDPAPGLGPDVRVGDLMQQFGLPVNLHPNAVGRYAAPIDGPISGSRAAAGIWVGDTNATQQVLARPSAVNALPGLEYRAFSHTSVDAAGALAFLATVNSAGTNDSLVMVGAPGAETVLAREGDPAPGTGVAFGPLTLASAVQPELSASGHVAFVAAVQGEGVTAENQRGVWLGRAGDLRLLARAGDPAPGTEPGVVFGNLVFSQPAINARGEAAMRAGIEGSAVGLGDNAGLWCGTPEDFALVVRKGGTLHTRGMDRTVFTTSLAAKSGGQNGRGRGLNDLGQLVFQVTFQAGQGQAIILRGPTDRPPSINLIGGTVTMAVHTVFADPGFTATDPEDGDLTAAVTADASAVNPDSPGAYAVTYDVTDSAGQAAAQRIRQVVVAEDFDRDGLLDLWEWQFTNTLAALGSPGDADRDGSQDSDEFAAGTDPLDPLDVLRISALEANTPGRMIGWAGKATRVYTVQSTTNLATGAWTDTLIVEQPGVEGVNVGDPGENAPGLRYFRVRPDPPRSDD